MVMSNSIRATSGAKFYIGPAADTPPADATTAAALTFTQVRKTSDFGQFGDESQIVGFDATDTQRREKVKGNRDAGDFTFNVGRVAGDAGQAAMAAAAASDGNYVFKLVMDDQPINGTKPTTFYLFGLVSNWRQNPQGANSVHMIAATIALNAAPIEDPAA